MEARRRVGVVLVALVATLGIVGSTVLTGAVTAAPAAAAEDRPAKGERGSWQVDTLDPGRYQVAWRSPTRLPITSDRPTVVGPAEVQVGPSTVATDGRTVLAVVSATSAPDPADLDVLLSGDRLDVVGVDRSRPGSAPARALDLPGTVTLDEDPATPGPHDVTTSDYDLDPVKLPGMREPIEMVGHVVEPALAAATGPRPLVLFLHGRHGVCYDPDEKYGGGVDWPCRAPNREIPSQLGYDYMQQVLASQGYATVSVRVNGINAQDYRLPDGGADARAEIVEAHLDHWVGLAAEHRIDLDRVVLVGHSRGGEGVDRASIQIPLSAPYRIAGQVLIAPTDFGNQTAPYVPTVTMLPFCDGDVSDLQGQKFTDLARDLTDGDTSLKSSVMVMGANHNFFNTEWTPGLAAAPAWDDWGGRGRGECGSQNADRLSAEEQQAVGTAYVAGAVHLFSQDDQDVLPLFDGSRARVESTGDAQVLSHAIGGGRDVRAPGRGVSRALPDGASTRICRGTFAQDKRASCSWGLDYQVHPHWVDPWEQQRNRQFLEMSWTAPGQDGGLLLEEPLDLSADRLELRTIADPERGPVQVQVRITDGEGNEALLTPVGGGNVPGLGASPRYWAQTIVVDPTDGVGVDLSRIVRVDLVAGSDRGRVWVADLAAAPADLAEVPDERLPLVDLGNVRVPEGDVVGEVTADLPFQVVGEVSAPARISVATSGAGSRRSQRFTIDLAPGQTSGTIPVTYLSDRVHDLGTMRTDVAVWPLRNVMTDSYRGSLIVVDDDPAPVARVRPVARRVSEGDPAQWTVTLDRVAGYDLSVIARVVRGPRPALSGEDVPAGWLRRHARRPTEASKPLSAHRTVVVERLRAGRTQLVLSVPTRADREPERRESVTLRVRVGDSTVERTVWVRG
ncbi:MAG: hypothetical protein WBP61_06690 [Nocardioides sp.]